MRIPPSMRSDVARRSRGDDIARAFRHELIETFRESVFRSSDVAPAAEIYVSHRTWRLGGRSPETRLAYEHYLYQQLQNHNSSVLLVIAGAGVGKTTFLHYFFQHFEPCPAGIPMCPPRDQYLFLYCDIRQPEPREVAIENAYKVWFNILNEDFKASHGGVDLDDWDGFAIYDELMHWSPLAASAEPREQRIKHRLQARVSHKFSYREKLHAAISLRRQVAPESRRKLVFLPDNLDQNDLTCQHQLISDILNLVQKLGHEEAMLVLPLRPETRARLTRRRSPLPEHRLELELGACDETLLIGSRLSCLSRHVGSSFRIVDIDTEDEFRDRAYTPIRAREAADILGDAIRWGLEDTIAPESGPAVMLLGKIVSGSARRSNSLRLRVAFSGVAKQKRLMRQRPHLSPYAFLDACLSGEEGMLTPGNNCNLLNLFDTARSGRYREDAAFASIVGFHMLHLLRLGKNETSQIRGLLKAVGHPAEFIEECLTTYQECGVFHLIDIEESGNKEIIAEAELVEAHYRLLEQPAYVDHVAMTTPVDSKRAAEMKVTSGSHPEDFVARIKTTFKFLEQIREDERLVFGMAQSQPPVSDRDSEERRQALRRLRFPSAWAIMALQYRLRLKFIMDHGKLPPTVDREEFRHMAEDHDILRVTWEDTRRPFMDW